MRSDGDAAKEVQSARPRSIVITKKLTIARSKDLVAGSFASQSVPVHGGIMKVKAKAKRESHKIMRSEEEQRGSCV